VLAAAVSAAVGQPVAFNLHVLDSSGRCRTGMPLAAVCAAPATDASHPAGLPTAVCLCMQACFPVARAHVSLPLAHHLQAAVTLASRALQSAQQRGASRMAAARIAAKVLTRAALDGGSKDNITVMVVDLAPYEGPVHHSGDSHH
jgi:hypothetical protein